MCRSEEHGEPSGGGSVARGRTQGKEGKRHGKLVFSEMSAANHGEGGPHRRDKVKGKSKFTANSAASSHGEDSEELHSSGTVLVSRGRHGKGMHAEESRTAAVAGISSKRLKAYGLTAGTTKKRRGLRKAARTK